MSVPAWSFDQNSIGNLSTPRKRCCFLWGCVLILPPQIMTMKSEKVQKEDSIFFQWSKRNACIPGPSFYLQGFQMSSDESFECGCFPLSFSTEHGIMDFFCIFLFNIWGMSYVLVPKISFTYLHPSPFYWKVSATQH